MMYDEMYDELIKQLRSAANPKREFDNELFLEDIAADAIEDLQKQLQKSEVDNINLTGWLAEEHAKHLWIPVTERLPESGVHVLACCRVKWVGGGGRSYVCDAFYSAPKTEICSYNEDIETEYDEETDEYYMPEGWWEVIKNWDDYSFVAIADFVTHWMPLPEPPKEG